MRKTQNNSFNNFIQKHYSKDIVCENDSKFQINKSIDSSNKTTRKITKLIYNFIDNKQHK